MSIKSKMLCMGLLISSLLFGGCATQGVWLPEWKAAAETNLRGVRKISICPFNSITDPSEQRLTADEKTCALAREALVEAFSESGHFELIELAESPLDFSVMQADFDGVIVGEVWWQVDPVYNVHGWDNVQTGVTKYRVRYNDEGKPVGTYAYDYTYYDNLEPHYRRFLNATLVMRLHMYKLDRQGASVFMEPLVYYIDFGMASVMSDQGRTELPRGDAGLKNLLTNYEEESLNSKLEMIGKKKKIQKQIGETIETVGRKDQIENRFGNEVLPTSEQLKHILCRKISNGFVARISPSKEFLVVYPAQNGDTGLKNLVVGGAFVYAIDWGVRQVLAGGYDDVYEMINEVYYYEDLIAGMKERIRLDYEAVEQAKPVEKRRPFELEEEKWTRQADSLLRTHIDDIYNIGLAYEGSGMGLGFAQDMYMLALELSPTHRECATALGRVERSLGQWKKIRRQEKLAGGS